MEYLKLTDDVLVETVPDPEPTSPPVTSTADYDVTLKTLDGSTIEISANRGTQATGHVTGNPLDATAFGAVGALLRDRDGTVAEVVFLDDSDLTTVIDVLRTAQSVAQSRNPINDRRFTPSS